MQLYSKAQEFQIFNCIPTLHPKNQMYSESNKKQIVSVEEKQDFFCPYEALPNNPFLGSTT